MCSLVFRNECNVEARWQMSDNVQVGTVKSYFMASGGREGLQVWWGVLMGGERKDLEDLTVLTLTYVS